VEKFHRGIPASGRIAIGEAVVFLKSNIFIPKYTINQDAGSIENEIEKLENALLKTRNQLEILKTDVIKNQPEFETGYLDSTILMLDDPLILNKVTEKIEKNYLNIEWIFNEVIEEIANRLHESKDVYIRERAPDVISVGHRVLKNLLGRKELDVPDIGNNIIVVAHTLSPPEIVSLYKKKVSAFVTEIGGRTSHVAIMSRDIQIPAVIGVKDITKHVETGDRIIVDGTAGIVVVNPEKDTAFLYKYKERDQLSYVKNLRKIVKKACRLKGGEEISLLANMDLEEELDLVKQCGCKGIGLFRTEYIFLNRKEPPNEKEQVSIYKRIIKNIHPNEVTIRIIDIGGDKKPPYIEEYEEANPFLGLRGIRYVLAHRDILKTQIRAVLRAAYLGNTRLMFPMVNDPDEIGEILTIVEGCKNELRDQHLPFDGEIQIGIMVETPSSVILLDKISGFVDFISVGTNDLIQYTLAIDRGNGMVADEFDPIHPAILRSLKKINEIAAQNELEVSICGEMAGDPLYSLLLIGLGYRKLSMSTVTIPLIKHIIINSSLKDAREIASKTLEFSLKKDTGIYLRDEMISRFKYLEDYFRQNV